MGDWLLLTGREAMVAAIHDPATAMSTGLAEKLDALSGEEWDELTRWLSARTSIAAESLGIVLVRRQALASALFARYGDVVMARPSVRVPSGPPPASGRSSTGPRTPTGSSTTPGGSPVADPREALAPRTEAGRRFHANEHGSICSFAATGSCALVNDGPWGKAWIAQIEDEALAARQDDASPALHAWSNEEDELFIEVADEPDRDRAGQRYATQARLALTYVSRTKIRTQDCECVPTSDACPDDDAGKPCVVREGVDVWVFQGWDPGFQDVVDDLAGERRDRLASGKPVLLYLPPGIADPFAEPGVPQPIPVAPGQVEAGL